MKKHKKKKKKFISLKLHLIGVRFINKYRLHLSGHFIYKNESYTIGTAVECGGCKRMVAQHTIFAITGWYFLEGAEFDKPHFFCSKECHTLWMFNNLSGRRTNGAAV